jgi:hypothetical protein
VLAAQHEGRDELVAAVVDLEAAISAPDAARARPGLMVADLHALAVGRLDVADGHPIPAAEDDLLDGDVSGPDEVPGRDSHTSIGGKEERGHQRWYLNHSISRRLTIE